MVTGCPLTECLNIKVEPRGVPFNSGVVEIGFRGTVREDACS